MAMRVKKKDINKDAKKKSGSYVTGARTSRNDAETITNAGDWSDQKTKLVTGQQFNTLGDYARKAHGKRNISDSYARDMMDLDRSGGFQSTYQNPGPALQGYTGAMTKRHVRELNANRPTAKLQGRGSAEAQLQARAAAISQSKKSVRQTARMDKKASRAARRS